MYNYRDEMNDGFGQQTWKVKKRQADNMADNMTRMEVN